MQTNLLEGADAGDRSVVLMLGNMRAALITARHIRCHCDPITGMVATKVSANLMSLGALDFGLIVDGSVIIVENCILRLSGRQHRLGRLLTLDERFQTVFSATREVFTPALVSVLVVILVNLPLLALTGVEGKMFTPMALAVIIAFLRRLVLSVTFVPAAVALLLRGHISEKDNVDCSRGQESLFPTLAAALRFRIPVAWEPCYSCLDAAGWPLGWAPNSFPTWTKVISRFRHCEFPVLVSPSRSTCSSSWNVPFSNCPRLKAFFSR